MKDVCDSYFSVRKEGRGLYKSLGSRFIAFSYPIDSAEEAMAKVALLRKEYHDARHCCFAYRLGMEGETWRISDDGEPSSSAGRPILNQMISAAVSDTLVVVVRYFGGVKLGIPGLMTAYREAAAQAIEDGGKAERHIGATYLVTFPYDLMPALMTLLKSLEVPFGDLHQDCECSLKVRVRMSKDANFKDRIEEICTLSQKKITLNIV